VRLNAPFLAALLLVLASCDQAANRSSVLWTNVPEMAAYVERFNASQRDWQILVEYNDDPAPALLTPGRKADLVIARGLASAEVKDTMVPLDFLFDGGGLAKASFYRRITDAGQQGDRFKLLPLSFDLPILIFSKKVLPDLAGFSIDLDTVKALGARFAVATETKVPKKLGFSPRWQAFGLTLLQLKGASFQEGFQSSLTWDSGRFIEGTTLLRSWPSPGWDAVTEFQRKYLQGDPTPPLTAGRVQFYPSTLAAFESRPWEERRDLDFRYLDEGGRVAATDTTVWAGIPSSSLTRGAGERFLAWFFQAEEQKKMLLQARSDDDRNFGLAGGLSSLVLPNETALATAYPEMAGRLPGADDVTFWGTLPADWTTLKSAVLKPWLETPTGTEADLRAALTKHRTQASRN
jgi:ABC-type glycerol-3-phosphate transport system substrate-binding protein